MNKKLILLTIVIAFFIFFMVSFSFPDLFAMFYVPNMITEGNIYTLVKIKKSVCPWLDATYPPLYYLTMGNYLYLIKKLGLISNSLFTINSCPVWELILNKNFLFWAKLPFFLLHFASAWIFSKFFNKNQFKWFLLWLLNPVAIFVSFIQGQFEIIPTFFMLLSLYFAREKSYAYSFLSLGIGGAFKMSPFLLLIPFLIIFGDSLWKKLSYAIVAIIPYFLSVIPLYNNDFLQSLRFSENYKMLELGFHLADIKISIYVVLYLLLIFLLAIEKEKNFYALVKYSLLFVLIYFISTFWFVQRLLFLIPSLLIFASWRKKLFNILPFFYIVYFFYAQTAFPGLFDHTLLRPLISSVRSIDTHSFIFFQNYFRQIVLSLMTGFFIWIGYFVLKKSPEKIIIVDEKDIFKSLTSLVFYLALVALLFFISNNQNNISFLGL